MTAVFVLTAALLSVAALLTTALLIRGPSVFDRILALDVLSVLLLSGIAVLAAIRRSADYAPSLIAIALLGFVATVAGTRYAEGRHHH